MKKNLIPLALLACLCFSGVFPSPVSARQAHLGPGVPTRSDVARQTNVARRIDLLPFAGGELSGKNNHETHLHFYEQVALVARYRSVWPDGPWDLVSAIRENDELALDLFTDKSLMATVSRVDHHVNGSLVITAIPKGQSGYFVLSVNGPRALGVLSLPSEDLFCQILHDPVSHEHYIVEMPANAMHAWAVSAGGGCLDATDAEAIRGEEMKATGLSPSPLGPTGQSIEADRIRMALEEKGLGPADTASIRVMVVYTEDAMAWADEHGGGIENVVSLSMATAQLTLDNSEVGIELVLAHAAMVDYTESGISQVDLHRFASAPGKPPMQDSLMGHYIPGYMDEIHTWRDEYRADLCAIFTRTGTGAVGFLLETRNGAPDYAFSRSPIRVVAQDLTHIHELGHNMGCHHNTNHSTQPGPTIWTSWPRNNWSAAWSWTGSDEEQYGSVMRGATHEDVFVWTKPYFSNPQVNHLGAPTGHPEFGDNARTLREMKHVIAAYRSNPLSLESDSLALVALYQSTGGPDWKNNDNWLTGPLHTWYGLEFGVFLRHINLRDNNLSGVIPPEIGELVTLERLDLSSNQLSGQIPPGIGNLHGLVELNLSFNALSGRLPDEMEGLETLRILSMAMNNLSGSLPAWFGNLINLQWLQINYNNFTGSIPPELGLLSDLDGLVLSDNLLEGPIPPEMGGLSALSYIDLSFNSLEGPLPESFINLTNLRYLLVYDCKLEGVIPVGICDLPNLQGININQNLFDLESCPAVSCLKARGILQGTGVQQNGIELGSECPEKYVLTLSADPPKAATLEGGGVFLPGEEVVIKAFPGPGYSFSKWSGDTTWLSDVTAPETSLQMPEKHIVLTAVLEQIKLVIQASAGMYGRIEPEGAVEVPYGQNQAFLITPDEGYLTEFIRVNGDPVDTATDNGWDSQTGQYTFKAVVNDHSIEVGFVADHTSVMDVFGQTAEIYPNPASGFFTLRFDNQGSSQASVLLYNSQGQLLQRKEVDGKGWLEVPFRVEGLARGLYILRIESGRHVPASKVVIK